MPLFNEIATNQQLLKAAVEGQTARLIHLVQNGAAIEYQDAAGWTAHHHACFAGHEDTVEALLGHVVDIDAMSQRHGTPLCLAAAQGHVQIVTQLLQKNTSPLSACGGLGTVMYSACLSGDEEVARFVLQRSLNAATAVANLDVDVIHETQIRDEKNLVSFYKLECHPIHLGAMFGTPDLIEMLLLLYGADVDTRFSVLQENIDGWDTTITALMAAARTGNTAGVEKLLQHGAEVNAQSETGLTPMLCALDSTSDSCVLALLEAHADLSHRNWHGHTPLMHAVTKGETSTLGILLTSGSDCDGRGRHDLTAAHVATQLGHAACLALLLAYGADVDSTSDEGRTPLTFAAENGRVRSVEVLLERGASHTFRDAKGFDPIRYAIERDLPDVLETISRMTGDTFADIRYEDGRTALVTATEKQKMKAAGVLAKLAPA